MSSRLSERVVDRLFVRLTSIYGHLWASQYSEPRTLIAARAEWAHALGDFTLDQIADGINRSTAAYERPPTLPQFKKLCARPKVEPLHVTYQPMPSVPADPARVASAIAEARKGLSNMPLRSVLNADGWAGWLRDLAMAKSRGINERDFERQRLEANGYTMQREAALKTHAARISYNINSPLG